MTGKKMIQIAIDGPAASGKSTAARALAERLGGYYVNTGDMYRTVAWAALQAGIDPDSLPLAAAAVDLDGSADNVLAALYGGACLNIMDGGVLQLSIPLKISPKLRFVVGVPELPLKTSKTRRVLPEKVALGEAVQNSARLAALVRALEAGDCSNLRELIQSPLHIPYRSRLIPGYQSIEELAYEAGALAVTISGAGPSVLALATDYFQAIGEAMVHGFGQAGLAARYVVSEVNSKGVVVERCR